jgi:hypothetical protein
MAFAAVFLSSPLNVLAQQNTAKPADIDRNGVLILIRSTLLALDHANKTGNYSVLRALGSPGFQKLTVERLAEIFAKQRNDKLDLSGVAALDPQLSVLPQIQPNGMLFMKGYFPSVTSQLNFELLFEPVEGQWKLFGISVGIGQIAPAAPPPTDSPSGTTQQQQSKGRQPQKQQ